MISWRLMTMLTYEEACLTPKAKKPKKKQKTRKSGIDHNVD